MALKTMMKKPDSVDESNTAAVLSMKLKQMSPDLEKAKPPKAAANSADDGDDMWDNMPV